MSESIYICAGSLCCTLVICSILRIVSPSGSTQKIMAVVMGVFSLCCLVSPVYELVKNINYIDVDSDINSSLYENYETKYDSKVIEITAEFINEYVYSLLDSCGVKDARIETVLAKDDSRGIYVRELNIYLNGRNNADFNKISGLINSAIGVKPNISEC